MPATVTGIHLGPDTHANRPAANASGLPFGSLYMCSDHSLIYKTDGSAWSTWATLGGGGVTVQEEGVSLATAGTTLNFTGAGVTASGTTATKTINIPSGGSSNPQAHHWASAAPSSPATENDEFDDSSIDAKWTRVNSATIKGAWGEQEGALHWSYTAAATSDMDVYAQARTISVGHKVEAGFVIPPWNGITTYVGCALGFSDGATHGAGAQVMGGAHLLSLDRMRHMLNSWTNFSTRGTDGTIADFGAPGTTIYYQVKYEAANTWGLYLSVDGKSWRTIQSNFARTLTPTHIFVGAQMFSSPAVETGKGIRIEYVRYLTS